METQVCSACKAEFPLTLEFFAKNIGNKTGFTVRCKPCLNEANKRYEAAKKARDPVAYNKKENERQKAWYRKNLEKSREYARKKAAEDRADPVKRARINMRGRANSAGFTIEEFDVMLASQGGGCAVCGITAPALETGVNGWNLDHCHKTKKVRFILCRGCNHGLGNFQDDPARLRRAADLLEEQQKS